MTRTVAVVAHGRKQLRGAGPEALRAALADEGVTEPLWFEVKKSRKAPKKAKRALREGAELVLVWGGDGMVQRCVDAVAGSGVPVGLLPAGTANLLASDLGIPQDLRPALRTALHGRPRTLDVGRLDVGKDRQHFAVMAGVGFDAALVGGADRRAKARLGRLAYVRSGLKGVSGPTVEAKVTVDGHVWYRGPASCVLFGNVGRITGGIPAFDDAEPDDGLLEVGVATASGALQWARTLGRMALGRSERSPFVRITRGRKIQVSLGAPLPVELDGGARGEVRELTARIVPGALTVLVPERRPAGS